MDAKLKTDQGKVIVEGKTAVPFKTFVQLVLQRKVLSLFKNWGKEPVIIDSELLTDLASAAQDTQENREHLVAVTLSVGVLAGVFVLAVVQIALFFWQIQLGQQELILVASTLLGLAILTFIMSKMKRKKRGQKLAESMEKLASMLAE